MPPKKRPSTVPNPPSTLRLPPDAEVTLESSHNTQGTHHLDQAIVDIALLKSGHETITEALEEVKDSFDSLDEKFIMLLDSLQSRRAMTAADHAVYMGSPPMTANGMMKRLPRNNSPGWIQLL